MQTKRVTVRAAAVAVLLLLAATAVVGAAANRSTGGAPAVVSTPTATPIEPVFVACTMEAKVCPDGSAVGRAGPECAFDPCPLENGAGIVQGAVTIDGQPGTADDYARELIVFSGSAGQHQKTVAINPDGTYAAWLWPGTYTVDIVTAGGSTAAGLPAEVTITEGGSTDVNIDITPGGAANPGAE